MDYLDTLLPVKKGYNKLEQKCEVYCMTDKFVIPAWFWIQHYLKDNVYLLKSVSDASVSPKVTERMFADIIRQAEIFQDGAYKLVPQFLVYDVKLRKWLSVNPDDDTWCLGFDNGKGTTIVWNAYPYANIKLGNFSPEWNGRQEMKYNVAMEGLGKASLPCRLISAAPNYGEQYVISAPIKGWESDS